MTKYNDLGSLMSLWSQRSPSVPYPNFSPYMGIIVYVNKCLCKTVFVGPSIPYRCISRKHGWALLSPGIGSKILSCPALQTATSLHAQVSSARLGHRMARYELCLYSHMQIIPGLFIIANAIGMSVSSQAEFLGHNDKEKSLCMFSSDAFLKTESFRLRVLESTAVQPTHREGWLCIIYITRGLSEEHSETAAVKASTPSTVKRERILKSRFKGIRWFSEILGAGDGLGACLMLHWDEPCTASRSR